MSNSNDAHGAGRCMSGHATNNVEFEQSKSVADDTDRRVLSTLQASAALAGCGLHELASGAFLLTRWGIAKECPDLRSVSVLLERMTGART